MINSYFTINEADLFSFYRIPKELFTNPKYRDTLSSDSKILYGLLLDRNSLSLKNGWIDDRGFVYIIYTREEGMEMLGVKKEKITKLFKELIEVGLIEEVRQGLNKPNIIFVKKFITSDKEPETIDKSRKFENRTSRGSKIELPEVRKSNPNNTDNNNTDNNKSVSLSSIHQNANENPLDRQTDFTPIPENKSDDTTEDNLQPIYDQAQMELFEPDLQLFLKDILKDFHTNPLIATILKMNLTNQEIRDKLKFLRREHLDRAIHKYSEASETKGVKNIKLYFQKVLISSIIELPIEKLTSDCYDDA
jgi:hypothetical protein